MTSLGGDLGPSTSGKKDQVVTLGEMVKLAEEDYEVSNGSKAAYYTVNCYLSWIFIDETLNRTLFYLACQQCKKKVMDEDNGYFCTSCNKSYQNAVPTYNF